MNKKVFEVDLNGLTSRQQRRFIDFYRQHKTQSPQEIVEAYSQGIHQHVFLMIKESGEQQ